MHPLTHSAIPAVDSLGPWLAMVGLGMYHGINPGMGWLFAFSLGLQQRSERAIWISLLPITTGHAASVLVLAARNLVPLATLRLATALLLLSFGMYRLFTYYRHPRWVGMRVGLRDLFAWSFMMAFAHGAGLMVAPFMLSIAETGGSELSLSPGAGVAFAIVLHTLSMAGVMAAVAWVVYKKLGLRVLRQSWVNFDLIWAVALLVVGGIALSHALWS
jgi:hypothetical protein